ncbi:MAG: 23S rRNA (adenine(2503)-C(2))-methyltransferase RlmN [Verrucomicrobiae bacterium]|nr:23S rRNA (adenine(2503)-C(2))-methyltransferase RlmN [Verrucomicrobiae bacterium]
MTKSTEAERAAGAAEAPALQALSREELLAVVQEAGEPAYRADQILEWLYRRRVEGWEAMTNLPKRLRARLGEMLPVRPLRLVRVQGSADATRKFLWRLGDGALVESVLIPANPALYGDRSDRRTLCVSTQVGCAYGCKFCASGLLGWKRNLTPDEIVEQVLAVERWQAREAGRGEGGTEGALERAVDNLVIMGMGEPLANYAHLMKALTILNAPWGGGIGARKITVSTSGLAPQIRQLAEQPLQVQLAISLHGATDEVRGRLMPVNRKYPLSELVAACEYYVERKGRMITLEYILIEGVNDALSEAARLAALARRLHAKVNLIPYNRVEGLAWKRPAESQCEAFLAVLQQRRVTATLRREKGHDIDAACGQLRLRVEQEMGGGGRGSGLEKS